MWENIDVNYWAVLVAGIASMVIGFIWYSMGVFGRTWMNLIGKSEEDLKKGATGTLYFGSYILAIVTAYILAHFLAVGGADTIGEGLVTAFWLWLGFVFTGSLMNSMYEGRPVKLFWINSIYTLVNLLVMAIVLVLWK